MSICLHSQCKHRVYSGYHVRQVTKIGASTRAETCAAQFDIQCPCVFLVKRTENLATDYVFVSRLPLHIDLKFRERHIILQFELHPISTDSELQRDFSGNRRRFWMTSSSSLNYTFTTTTKHWSHFCSAEILVLVIAEYCEGFPSSIQRLENGCIDIPSATRFLEIWSDILADPFWLK